MNEKHYMTAIDVGEMIKRSVTHVVTLADSGRLRCEGRTPRGIRIFLREDVDRYLAEERERKLQRRSEDLKA